MPKVKEYYAKNYFIRTIVYTSDNMKRDKKIFLKSNFQISVKYLVVFITYKFA